MKMINVLIMTLHNISDNTRVWNQMSIQIDACNTIADYMHFIFERLARLSHASFFMYSYRRSLKVH